MITKEEIEKLNGLARVGFADSETEKLQNDLAKILDFVSRLKEARVPDGEEVASEEIKNVLREDESLSALEEHADALLEQAPEKEGVFVKIKNIFNGRD